MAELIKKTGFENVIVVGRPGDQGVDIRAEKRDAFGTTNVYVFQCKRYQENNKVPPETVRAFHGTLHSLQTQEGTTGFKGILITTSDFTSQSYEEAKRLGIDLISGSKLLAHMKKDQLPLA
jgi:restriction endonuclease Mrr